MTSKAMADIGPSTPSKVAITIRCNRIIDHAKHAKDLCSKGEPTAAMKWMDAIKRETTFGED